MSYQQLFKVKVLLGRMECQFKGRFSSMAEALSYYSRQGRVIEIKEVSR